MKKYIEISFNYNEEADKNIAKRKKSEKRQSVNAYISYMMIGSYFKRCTPVSPVRRNFYYLHYKEINPDTQYIREEMIENIFLKNYGKRIREFGEMICKADFREEGMNVCVDFRTGIYDFTAVIAPDGHVRFEEK